MVVDTYLNIQIVLDSALGLVSAGIGDHLWAYDSPPKITDSQLDSLSAAKQHCAIY